MVDKNFEMGSSIEAYKNISNYLCVESIFKGLHCMGNLVCRILVIYRKVIFKEKKFNFSFINPIYLILLSISFSDMFIKSFFLKYYFLIFIFDYESFI
ncbi:hypothetical protein A7978_05925 (plasmid) [Borrelia turicatae]|uniref:Uncharacterized protein n=1 Tax=Borrelia turicatae TaxID=142 RepID=A0A172XCW1_BORTU|nr:hypothetical protein A7978_05925 [Borrelia turicatae]